MARRDRTVGSVVVLFAFSVEFGYNNCLPKIEIPYIGHTGIETGCMASFRRSHIGIGSASAF